MAQLRRLRGLFMCPTSRPSSGAEPNAQLKCPALWPTSGAQTELVVSRKSLFLQIHNYKISGSPLGVNPQCSRDPAHFPRVPQRTNYPLQSIPKVVLKKMLGHLTCIIFTYYRSTCGAGALSAATTTCSASSWSATCPLLTSASLTT